MSHDMKLMTSHLTTKVSEEDVEHTVLGPRSQDGFVQRATHEFTVVNYDNWGEK